MSIRPGWDGGDGLGWGTHARLALELRASRAIRTRLGPLAPAKAKSVHLVNGLRAKHLGVDPLRWTVN